MGKKIPSSIIIERLLFQQGRDLLISPTPLIPLPSDWFQSKPVRSMLVRGKMVEDWGRLAAPAFKRTTLSQQFDFNTNVPRSWERAG